MIRQTSRTICILSFVIFGWVTASVAATGTISMDWRSMEVVLYALPPDGQKLADLKPDISYSYVEAWVEDDSVFYETYSDADLSASITSANASASLTSLSCELSLFGGEGYTGAFTEREAYGTSIETGLLMVSINYAWDFTEFSLKSNDYIEGEFYMELNIWDVDSDGRYSDSLSSAYEFIDLAINPTLSSGSGTLTVYAQLDAGQEFELYFGEELEGFVEAETPIPGSIMMLFSGLGCLAVIKRKR